MKMVGAAVLGAALGTGAALLIAMTIVVYRYYNFKRQNKEWNYIDKLPYKSVPQQQKVLHKPVGTYPRTDFNVTKEQHNVQPPQNVSQNSMTADIMKNPLEICSSHTTTAPLQHQSRSYPGGPPLLCRTPSASSQSSIDSSTSKQGSHRGSSPQIRAFAPDGKAHYHHEATHTSSYPLHHQRGSSRSPSPHRAASLDIRSSSPCFGHISPGCDLRTPSPSQSSLASLTGGGSGSSCNSPVPASPRNTTFTRCLSPLLIPPSRSNEGACGGPPASPLGAIQPDLYLKKEEPLFIGGDTHKEGGSLGRLHFRLSYDFDRSDLVVHLIEAHDLAGSDQGGFNDPYVKLLILPEVDPRKRQTNIHRNDANPVFNEIFKFPVSHEELQLKTLLFQVFDYDKFSRNDIIGEVSMPLTDFDCGRNVEVWGEITKNKKPPGEMQEILLSLMYLPSAERLTLNLVKARNLFPPNDKVEIDSLVKVYLTVNGKRSKKKKSSVKKGTSNPVWNEALIFNMSSSTMQNSEFEICVYDQGNDIMGSNLLLGTCILGPKSPYSSGKEHWNDMLLSPRKSVFCWHTLRTYSAETGQTK